RVPQITKIFILRPPFFLVMGMLSLFLTVGRKSFFEKNRGSKILIRFQWIFVMIHPFFTCPILYENTGKAKWQIM
ncbi:MAG: hypothetical protein RBT40_11915, partial [Petrimonas sp.]|nr:hypothetical protein [Petrimonas sp.]